MGAAESRQRPVRRGARRPGADDFALRFDGSPSDNHVVICDARRGVRPLCWVILVLLSGCGTRREPLQTSETFTWCPQSISFSPPPSRWWRQGTNGDGTLGVRFILTGGGGQCISLAGYSSFVERDRRAAIARLISQRDSLDEHEFLRQVSLARARTDDPLSEREATTATAVNS